MIAWNAWELIAAEQDVDISDTLVFGHRKVPLGNYITEVLVKKSKDRINKLGGKPKKYGNKVSFLDPEGK